MTVAERGAGSFASLFYIHTTLAKRMSFPGGSDSKAPAFNAGDSGLIPGSGRSPGEENGNPLQDSCMENHMDGGAWRATHKNSLSLLGV